MQLRSATFSDLSSIQVLFVDTINNVCRFDYSTEQLKVWASVVENKNRWEDAIKNDFFITAELDGVIVGFGSLSRGNYIDFLYINSEFLRCGIANAIYKELKNEATRIGTDKLTADVSKTALPFFFKKGFTIQHENKRLIKGVEIINYSMSQ